MKWTWTLTSRQPQHGVTSFRTLSPQSERCHLNPNVVTSIRRCHFSQNVVTSVRRSPHSDVHLSQTFTSLRRSPQSDVVTSERYHLSQNVATSVRTLPPQSECCHLSQNVATSVRMLPPQNVFTSIRHCHLGQTLSSQSEGCHLSHSEEPEAKGSLNTKVQINMGLSFDPLNQCFFFFTPALVVMDALFTK